MKRGEYYWHCLDGRLLALDEIGPYHAANILRMMSRSRLIRNAMSKDALSALAYASSAPDGASMAAEDAANELLEADVYARVEYAERLFPIAGALRKRVKRFGVEDYLYRDETVKPSRYPRQLKRIVRALATRLTEHLR